MSMGIDERVDSSIEAQEIRELIAAFDRFPPLFSRFIQEALRDADTSPSRMRILRAIALKGPSSMQSIAEGLCVAPRTVTSLVDGLEEEGLVVRRPHPTDRRTKVIEMTERGLEGYNRSESIYKEKLGTLFETLPRDTRRALLDGHKALAEKLSKI